jgi:putative FmdB family regulatory protein
MPTYEYACTSCGNRFEAFRRIDEDPLSVCEACGGALRKVFHPAGIVFKGSGFYATDSRSRPKAESGSKGDSGSESGSGDGKKKDQATPAAKEKTA